MEFFDLRPAGAGSSARPSVRSDRTGVYITVPAPIAEHCGLEGPRVRLMVGIEGAARAVRLSADEAGAWAIVRRKTSLQVVSAELRPKADVPETTVEFTCGQGELTLVLPSPWDLASEHLVVRANVKPRVNGKAKAERGEGHDVSDRA